MIVGKIDFVVGVADQPKCLEICLKSFIKYNKEYLNDIIILNNASELNIGFSLGEFDSKVKIHNYVKPTEKNGLTPLFTHYEMGIGLAQTEYVFISHVDVEYKTNLCEIFYKKALKEKPNCYLFGFGGGLPSESLRESDMCIMSRIHEWSMIINKQQFYDSGSSFNAHFDGKYNYDVSTKMYCDALKQNREIYCVDRLSDDYLDHFVGTKRTGFIEDIAAKRLIGYDF
jgi:hypothetical protein